MRQLLKLLACCAAAGPACAHPADRPPPAGAAGLRVESSAAADAWAVHYAGQRLMVYAFPRGQYKPCVRELASLGGPNILRDAPPDHLHHHALMYAIAVNGLNFWEEISGSGVQKPVASPPPELGRSPNGPQATLRQTLHWLAPQDAFLPDSPKLALLVEQRTLVLGVNEASREVSLRWTSAFEVGGRTNMVTLTGSSYFGLGMRFEAELDPLAVHWNAGGQPDVANNRQDVSPHAWAAVTFDRPGRPVTLAVFGDPANARSPATYFAMKTPFAYLSATQALDKEPLVYRAGDRFEVSYLVTLQPGVMSKAALDERARLFSSNSRR